MELGQIFKILDGVPKTPDYYTNKIFEETNLLTTQCYLINNDKDIFIKFQKGVEEHKLKNAINIKKMINIGLELKLTPEQAEKNTIFVNSAPITILETDPKQLLEEINGDNPNVVVISIYAPPAKSYSQKLTSLKITLASRVMTNSCFKYGIKIKGCFIDPANINQGLYSKIPQCKKCNHFHEAKHCTRTSPICAICGGDHEKFSCDSNEPRPFCINCKGRHRATSNLCPVRREFLTNDHIPDTKEEHLVSPFVTKNSKSFIPAPIPSTNFWDPTPEPNNSLPSSDTTSSIPPTAKVGSPLTTYSDCLKMSLEFKQWYPTFLILQTLTGLQKLELPDSLRNTINIQNTAKEQNNTPQNQTTINNQAEPTQSPSPFFIPAPNKNSKMPPLPWPPLGPDIVEFPLTGANTIPLPQRLNPIRPHKEPLLPTPPDPFQFSRNSGAIKKTFSTHSTTHPYQRPPINQNRKINLQSGPKPQSSNFTNSNTSSIPTSSNSTVNTSSSHNHEPENSILNRVSTQTPKINDHTNPSTPLASAPLIAAAPTSPEGQPISKTAIPTKTTNNEEIYIINDTQISAPNKTQNISRSQNPSHPTTSPIESETPATSQPKIKAPINKGKPPITKPKPDLSKYRPTQEIPKFLKDKLPPNRHTMDPEQFRSTIKSFEALSNAAIKKAQKEYQETKEDFLLNTSLPEFKNLKTHNSFQILQDFPSDPQPPPNNTSSTSKNTSGTSKSNKNTIYTRKQYKHPTPPPQHSDSENEDDPAPIYNADSDTLPDLSHSPIHNSNKRLLRSNSRQHNSPPQ